MAAVEFRDVDVIFGDDSKAALDMLDRGEDRAPFIVESAEQLAELRASGAVGLALSWNSETHVNRNVARGVAALCSAHPGSAPVYVDWTDETGGSATLRSRSLRVQLNDDLISALRELVGVNHVRLVKAR